MGPVQAELCSHRTSLGNAMRRCEFTNLLPQQRTYVGANATASRPCNSGSPGIRGRGPLVSPRSGHETFDFGRRCPSPRTCERFFRGTFGARRSQRGRKFTRVPARLDMPCIGHLHRPVKSEFGAVSVEPLPHGFDVLVFAPNINGPAMAVAAGPGAAAVQRVTGARSITGGEALAVVVPKSAQDRPPDAGGVHRFAGVIKLLPETRVHAADHIIRHRHA